MIGYGTFGPLVDPSLEDAPDLCCAEDPTGLCTDHWMDLVTI